MGTKLVNDSSLTLVADEIRAKGETTEDLTFPQDFVRAIRNLNTGECNSFVIVKDETTYAEVLEAYEANKGFWLMKPTAGAVSANVAPVLKISHDETEGKFFFSVHSDYCVIEYYELSSPDTYTLMATSILATESYVDDAIAGIENPVESITFNEDGQLVVGGRLGQYPNGGVFYPTTIEPTNVGASSFLMTDGAKGLSVGGRQFGILAGANLTCKSAAAGATQYRLTNSQGNRFACFAGKNGRLAIDQNDAITNGTALITDISFANGNPISAYFGETERDNDIIITVDRTINPSAATTKLRIYGTSTSSDVIAVGQGVGGDKGKGIGLGQSCFVGGNQIIALGNSVIVLANNSSGFGHTHLINKQFCLAAGQGHDFTNASNGTSALGICSDLKSDTLFAVGNGVFASSGAITRSNAFEITSDGGVIVPSSTSGSTKKFKITVDDSGNLSATEV